VLVSAAMIERTLRRHASSAADENHYPVGALMRQWAERIYERLDRKPEAR